MKKASNARKERDDERLDRVFHALADRTRRSLVARLAQSPGTVTELSEPFAMSLPAVSKHIRVLEEAGLVVRAIDGRIHRCSLDAAPLADVEQWLTHYRSFWTETLEALALHVEEPDRAPPPARPSRKP